MTDFEMVTNAVQLVMLVQIENEFQLMLQLGKATKKYLDKMNQLLDDMGIKVTDKSDVCSVITDSDKQIL